MFLKIIFQGNNLHLSPCIKDNFWENSRSLPNNHAKVSQEVDVYQDDTYLPPLPLIASGEIHMTKSHYELMKEVLSLL